MSNCTFSLEASIVLSSIRPIQGDDNRWDELGKRLLVSTSTDSSHTEALWVDALPANGVVY